MSILKFGVSEFVLDIFGENMAFSNIYPILLLLIHIPTVVSNPGLGWTPDEKADFSEIAKISCVAISPLEKRPLNGTAAM